MRQEYGDQGHDRHNHPREPGIDSLLSPGNQEEGKQIANKTEQQKNSPALNGSRQALAMSEKIKRQNQRTDQHAKKHDRQRVYGGYRQCGKQKRRTPQQDKA